MNTVGNKQQKFNLNNSNSFYSYKNEHLFQNSSNLFAINPSFENTLVKSNFNRSSNVHRTLKRHSFNGIAKKVRQTPRRIDREFLLTEKSTIGTNFDSIDVTTMSSEETPQLMSANTYQSLVQPADHFQSPIFLSPPVIESVIDDDPIRADPLLLDLMHVEPGAFNFPHQSPSQQQHASFHDPLRDQLLMDPSPELLEHKEHHHVEHDLNKIYNHLRKTHPDVYDRYYRDKMLRTFGEKRPDLKNDEEEDGDYEEDDNGGDSAKLSKQPVAQNMLFHKNNKYYEPFKVSKSVVYRDYLRKQNHPRSGKCGKKSISEFDIEDAVNSAASKVDWYQEFIRDYALKTKRRMPPNIPSDTLNAKIFEYGSQNLNRKMCYKKLDIIKILPKINIDDVASNYEMKECDQDEQIWCNAKAKYRRIDSSCNNLKKKTWAKSFSCHRRLLPPDYGDGVSMPRLSEKNGKLPSARTLSSQLLPEIDIEDHKLTSMTMSFGQFIIHDITRTQPVGADVKCCPKKQAKHPECMAIDIEYEDDPLVKYFNQTCLNFVRSTICNPCAFGPREQQNQATHVFDMSHMYGLRLNDSLALRTLRGGLLRSSFTSTYPKQEILPKMAGENPGCNVRSKPPRFKCFESADGLRASQHPALQALHTAFHRRHNQHAQALTKINPHWKDEKLYQEARRIMIAELCVMIYGEYLPAIFGKKLMKHFRLKINYKGYTKYDPKLNPSTIQEFIVAAGRFGHSQVNNKFSVKLKEKKISYSYGLRDNFFETTIISLGHSAGVLLGLVMDTTKATDPYFTDDIKNQLYHLRNERLGRDLPAFNIQRGRDHGIPGYIYYLDFCFGFKAKSWNHLVTFIPKKQLAKIQAYYKHWKDIDLFVGGISERLIAGAAFGPTFACINGIQFYNFKYGDRFYFEHGYQAGSFRPDQLENIKKVSSLSSLICKTHPEIGKMPENPFIVPSSSHDNPMKPCHSFPEFDYKLWREEKYLSDEFHEDDESDTKLSTSFLDPKPNGRTKIKQRNTSRWKPPKIMIQNDVFPLDEKPFIFDHYTNLTKQSVDRRKFDSNYRNDDDEIKSNDIGYRYRRPSSIKIMMMIDDDHSTGYQQDDPTINAPLVYPQI